jgi:CheY-like chemotaxis protein
MPRLLLVDDNPSIHKIAETLLATSDVQLVCLDSGEEALRRVHAGEQFDVALLDIAMAGLDGWGLLEQLRMIPATARIPIAMMAGVLDTVDPERIQQAPIQGFLKKPVELRELGDRIHKLLETPVPVPSSAVDTFPATAVEDLLQGESDILVLGPEDLWPGEAAPVAPSAPMEGLELEELDLETLHGLQDEVPAAPAPAVEAELEPLELIEPLEPLEELPVSGPADAWADEAWEKSLPVAAEPARADDMPFLVTADELPDLGELVAAAEAPTIALEAPGPVLEGAPAEIELSLEEELDLGPPAPAHEGSFIILPAAGIGLAAAAGAAAMVFHDQPGPSPSAPAPAPAPVLPPLPEPAPGVAAERPPVVPGSSQALVDAILQDPAALDALAKALATHLSDRVLKEVAWEVMPELAGRLKR